MTSAVFRALRIASLTALTAGFLLAQAKAQEGPGPGAPGPGGNGAPHLPSSTVAPVPTGQGVEAASRAAETAIGQCGRDDRLCIADALDAYATALRNLSPPLAPELRSLPDVVSRAARQVRQAKTRAQAAKAIKIAIAAVHKTIALLKADDPVILKAETRQGAFVAETLAVAQNKLEKAVGL
jgi:predicted RNase H-like HicB family nuclease